MSSVKVMTAAADDDNNRLRSNVGFTQANAQIDSLGHTIGRSDLTALQKYQLTREYGKALKLAFIDQLEAAVKASGAETAGALQVRLMETKLRVDRQMTAMHGDYIALLDVDTSRALLKKLEFLRNYAKVLTGYISDLEADGAIRQEFRDRILKQAFKAFFQLADCADELSDKLVASSHSASVGAASG